MSLGQKEKRRAKIYKLQKDDYKKLYPYLQPKQVKEEFGDRAHSERTISQVYNDTFELRPNEFYAKYAFKKSFAIMDLSASSRQWIEYSHRKLEEIKSKRKRELWKKINQVEAITG